MKIIDLFSGIGGFSIAAHWMGWETLAFCERDVFCQKVLRKNFGNDIRIYDDINTFSGKPFRGRCDIITGGFPCQDISIANTSGKGLVGKNSGLWAQMLRVIEESRPRWVLIENVARLVKMGLDTVLFDLEAINYSARAVIIPACSLAAPHKRDRVWVIADSGEFVVSERGFKRSLASEAEETVRVRKSDIFNTNTHFNRGAWRQSWVENAIRTCIRGDDDGLSREMDRNRKPALRAYGNSIVPQIAFEIFKAIEFTEKQ